MNLDFLDNIILGISDIKDGPMKYDFANQQAFFKRQNLNSRKIIGAELEHGDNIVIVNSITLEQMIKNCDALITQDKNCLLTVTVADCLPIYFYDSKKQIVALAHAGWKGVLNNISAKTVLKLINELNCQPKDIEIFVGPHIQDCHFEVQADVANQFDPRYILKKNDKTYIQLATAVKDQLTKTGVPTNNISISSECTHCLSDKYFSFRRERDKIVKAMIAYIGLK
jgi:YfiH family protein